MGRRCAPLGLQGGVNASQGPKSYCQCHAKTSLVTFVQVIGRPPCQFSMGGVRQLNVMSCQPEWQLIQPTLLPYHQRWLCQRCLQVSHRGPWEPNCSGPGCLAFGRYKDVYISV